MKDATLSLGTSRYDVYVLENDHRMLYVGLTADLTRRYKEHCRGKCKTSRSKGDTNYRLVHAWGNLNYIQASKLERYLHRLQDWQILDIVLDLPVYNTFLARESGNLRTTPHEKAKCDCCPCGLPIWNCNHECY